LTALPRFLSIQVRRTKGYFINYLSVLFLLMATCITDRHQSMAEYLSLSQTNRMRLYQKLFAAKYDSFMKGIEISFFDLRKELIENLDGKILDVGSGTGVNFEHFNSTSEVISIEPSIYMLNKAKAKLPTNKNIKLYNLGINDVALNDLIAENSLDYAICTLVLCTVPKPELALKNIYKWLKPTGKLIIIEHIHAAEKYRRVFQNIINPAWKIIGDGCNLNRDTDKIIQEIGFKPDNETYFKRTLRFYSGVFGK